MTTTVYDQVWLLWHMFSKLSFMNQFFAKKGSQQVSPNILYSKYKKINWKKYQIILNKKTEGKIYEHINVIRVGIVCKIGPFIVWIKAYRKQINSRSYQ
jgi:hypothetical protein